MRKIALLVGLLILISNVYSQPQQGKIVLKGSSEFSGLFSSNDLEVGSSSFDHAENSQINFQPALGIIYLESFNVGLSVGYSYQKQSIDDENSKDVLLSVGPYIRGYFSQTKLAPFAQGYLGYASYYLEQKSDNNDPLDIKFKGFNYELGLGLEYFVAQRFSVDLLFNYSGISVRKKSHKTSAGSYTNEYSLVSKGFGFRLGVSVFLN